MIRSENSFIRGNKNLLFLIIIALTLGPVAQIFGLNSYFSFLLVLFLILFEGGAYILIAFAQFIKYLLKIEKGDSSLAVRAFWYGVIRVWVFSVLIYIT